MAKSLTKAQKIRTCVQDHHKGLKGQALDDEIAYFIADGKRYIKAAKEGRLLVAIDKVSANGLTRHLSIMELTTRTKTKRRHLLYFINLFDTMGFTKVKDSASIRVIGSGMDMTLATHIVMLKNLKKVGLLTAQQCEDLCRTTSPHHVTGQW